MPAPAPAEEEPVAAISAKSILSVKPAPLVVATPAATLAPEPAASPISLAASTMPEPVAEPAAENPMTKLIAAAVKH